jgi:hypothetical protein
MSTLAHKESKSALILPWTVILKPVKDLLYVFDPLEQTTSRFFVAALLRMTLRQSVQTREKLQPQFSKERPEGHVAQGMLRDLRGEVLFTT